MLQPINQNSNVTWYTPPIGAPIGNSLMASYLREASKKFQSPEHCFERIQNIFYAAIEILKLNLINILDFFFWLPPIFGPRDSWQNELSYFISILVFPFFSLFIPFGYFPKIDYRNHSLDRTFGIPLILNLDDNELLQLSETPNFWRRIQQSRTLHLRNAVEKLIEFAIRTDNPDLLRQILTTEQTAISLNADIRDLTRSITSIPVVNVLIELGFDVKRYWIEIHRASMRDVSVHFTEIEKPFIELLLQAGHRPENFKLEHYIIEADTSVEANTRIEIVKMLLRSGVSLSKSIEEIEECYDWLNRIRAIDTPEPREHNRNEVLALGNEALVKGTLKHYIFSRFLAGILVVEFDPSADARKQAERQQLLNNLNILRENFPKLRALQHKVGEIEEFTEKKHLYYTDEEFVQIAAKVKAYKTLLIKMELENPHFSYSDPNLPKEVIEFVGFL